MCKAYTNDEERYSGATTDNLDRKFRLFIERCDQAHIPECDRHRAFSIMLAGNARQFFFDALSNKNMDLMALSKGVKERLQTPERTRALLREWESLTLNGVMTNNREKTPYVCLELLISKLTDIQTSLPKEYRNDTILRNKLLNAVREVEDCRLAYHKPAESVQGVISDLHASLASAKHLPTGSSSRAPDEEPSAHFVDRRYQLQASSSSRSGLKQRRCIVCKKIGCWSTNHSAKGRIEAFRANKVLRQFMATLKDEDSNDEEQELLEALDDVTAHIIDVSSKAHDSDENLFSHLSSIEEDDEPSVFVSRLKCVSTFHALQGNTPRRFDGEFRGVMIDTGATRGSSGGKSQYFAYCKATGRKPDIDTSRAARCHFGIGTTISSGVGNISFTIGNLWMFFGLHVVDADTPILLSIDYMDRLGVYFQNLDNLLIHHDSGETADIVRLDGHPYLRWNTDIVSHFTLSELRRLHRRFGHPHVDKLVNVLKRAEIWTVYAETRKMLEKIEKSCVACQEYAQRPRRFKFTLRDDVYFNHNIYADIFYIDGKPILHIVDEATRFQSARWLSSVSSESLWKALRQCWIYVYLGPPDVITHDAGKNFMGRAFAGNSDMLHIATKSVPVESANSMSIVERYHSPLRRAFFIIKKEAPDVEDDYALQLAVKAINDSIGPDGLVPTLLVFGALPRLGLPTDQPTPSTFKRAVALRKATESMSRQFANRQVRDAMNSRNGPIVTEIHKTPIGSPVLVYIPEKDKWEGPFSLLDVKGEDCIVLLPYPAGPSKFRSTVVKPFVHDTTSNGNNEGSSGNIEGASANIVSTSDDSDVVRVFLKTISTNSFDFNDDIIFAWKAVLQQSDDNEFYAAARSAEFNGPIEKGVFTIVHKSEASGHRIYGSRFCDHIKDEGTPSA